MSKTGDYCEIIVETYQTGVMSLGHNGVVVRPIAGQAYPPNLNVQCSREINRDFPVGTRFRLKVKLTDKEGSGPFLYSSYKWPFTVVTSSSPSK
jgi:hypothetical protein